MNSCNVSFFLRNLMLVVDIAVCSFWMMVMMVTDFMTLAIGAQRKSNSHVLVNLDSNATRESHVGELGAHLRRGHFAVAVVSG